MESNEELDAAIQRQAKKVQKKLDELEAMVREECGGNPTIREEVSVLFLLVATLLVRADAEDERMKRHIKSYSDALERLKSKRSAPPTSGDANGGL